MKSTIATCIIAAAGHAAAAPRPGHFGQPFGLHAIYSDPDSQAGPIASRDSQFFVAPVKGLVDGEMGAVCDGPQPSQTNFFMSSDGALFLYHTGKGGLQQVYVEPSEEGGGSISYAKTDKVPDSALTTGWETQFDGANNFLTFRNNTATSCVTDEDPQTPILSINQWHLPGCVSLELVKLDAKDPVSCVYDE